MYDGAGWTRVGGLPAVQLPEVAAVYGLLDEAIVVELVEAGSGGQRIARGQLLEHEGERLVGDVRHLGDRVEGEVLPVGLPHLRVGAVQVVPADLQAKRLVRLQPVDAGQVGAHEPPDGLRALRHERARRGHRAHLVGTPISERSTRMLKPSLRAVSVAGAISGAASSAPDCMA